MIERLPSRYRSPAAARAITAPSAVLVAGAGASVAILGGIPLAGAALVGVVCWAGRVALGLPRQPRVEHIDPAAVREPWRRFVRQAVSARDRFDRAVRDADPGPLRDRLSEMAARVSVGATECWRIAKRANALDAAVAELDVATIRAELASCLHESARSPERSELAATAKALRSQLESAERLGQVAAGARDRLARIDAQLDEAVARALELSLQAGESGDLDPLGNAVDDVVGELESLRQALEESAKP
ncbi:MAG TPA: hypothetical protein VHS52_04525 [Acidimicrobiales bacterium]|nr:hypothetical protein [Acidimicrobiales bacterium]